MYRCVDVLSAQMHTFSAFPVESLHAPSRLFYIWYVLMLTISIWVHWVGSCNSQTMLFSPSIIIIIIFLFFYASCIVCGRSFGPSVWTQTTDAELSRIRIQLHLFYIHVHLPVPIFKLGNLFKSTREFNYHFCLNGSDHKCENYYYYSLPQTTIARNRRNTWI